jgi:tRNA nucleotidyltransferase (CCA-adding enzyme)
MNVIITHENGDFDALAAVVAASKLYPDSVVLMPEPLQPNVRSFVNLYRDLLPLIDPKDITTDIDTLIVIDTNRKERLGKWSNLLDEADQVIIYDHHPGDEDMGADLAEIEKVGAATTILLEKIISNDLVITDFEATLFALGIYEDTGCLTYDITTIRDARAVAFLWSKGLSTKMIQEYLRSPLSNAQKNLLEKLLHSSELYELNQRRVLISATVLDEYVVGAAVILQLLDEIEDAGLTIVIIQMTDSIYMAARTRDDDLDLLELFAAYDVKGYPAAVSTHLKNCGVEEVKKEVLAFLKSNLPPALTADKVASKPVFTITSDTSIAEADDLLAEHSYKGCPVMEGRKLAGIISRRDLRKGLRNDLGHAPVKGFMSRSPITATPEQSLTELRRLMVEENIGRVPIIDHDGQLFGIITRSDVLRHLSFLDRRGRSVKNFDRTANKSKPPGENDDSRQNYELETNLLELLNSQLSVRIRKLLLQISRLADREKVNIYLVGGIIRDLLLLYPPEKDLDFVVIGDAVAFTFSLQKLLGGSVRYFEQFGTASLQFTDGLRLDLVTARKEYYASPAALPQVESSSLKNDLFRRDFTINTMACSLSTANYGELYDYYNGQNDLRAKVIRALYALSFVDDPLRILRAVRFEQRYSFTIEPQTEELIRSASRRKVLEKVARQRLNQELKLIYREPSPLKIMHRLDQLGLFNALYPRANPDQKTWKLLAGIEDILQWLREREWDARPDAELAYLSALLFGLESADRSAIIKKLYLARERGLLVVTACREAPALLSKLSESELNPSMVVRHLEPLPFEALLLAHALSDDQVVKDHLKLYMDGLRYVRPRLNGSDLKKLGLKPGPRYRKIIESLKQAVLDGEVRTPQEEMNYVISFLETDQEEEE